LAGFGAGRKFSPMALFGTIPGIGPITDGQM
jgi:hypothetical protein